jgi:hypothetical protein
VGSVCLQGLFVGFVCLQGLFVSFVCFKEVFALRQVFERETCFNSLNQIKKRLVGRFGG